MHKPFKKTHQNIRKDEDDVQSRTREEKRDMTPRGESGTRGATQLRHVFALLILHFIIHLVKQTQNTVSSFKPVLVMVSTPHRRWSSDTNRQTNTKLCIKSNRKKELTGQSGMLLRKMSVFVAETPLQTFISLMRMIFLNVESTLSAANLQSWAHFNPLIINYLEPLAPEMHDFYVKFCHKVSSKTFIETS